MTDSNQTAFRCGAVVVGAVDAEPNLIGAFGRTLFEPSDLEVMDSLRSQFFSEETRVPSVAATLAGEKHLLFHLFLKELRRRASLANAEHGEVHGGIGIFRAKSLLQRRIYADAPANAQAGGINPEADLVSGALISTVVLIPKIGILDPKVVVGQHHRLARRSPDDGTTATSVLLPVDGDLHVPAIHPTIRRDWNFSVVSVNMPHL